MEIIHSISTEHKKTYKVSLPGHKVENEIEYRKTGCVLFTRDPNHMVPLIELQG